MSLVGKLEADVEIKAPAPAFHDVFGGRPHHLTTTTPDNIHTCDLHEGEFGKEGSAMQFEYTLDGKREVVKQVIEKIDDENLKIELYSKEGDLLNKYKSIKFTIQAIPKESGSLVHWTLEYEKISEDTPDPLSLLEFCVNITKDTDAHLNKE